LENCWLPLERDIQSVHQVPKLQNIPCRFRVRVRVRVNVGVGVKIGVRVKVGLVLRVRLGMSPALCANVMLIKSTGGSNERRNRASCMSATVTAGQSIVKPGQEIPAFGLGAPPMTTVVCTAVSEIFLLTLSLISSIRTKEPFFKAFIKPAFSGVGGNLTSAPQGLQLQFGLG
jgi:hypothetical protein